eukprot:GHVL01011168.1.p2 GENE.GHVL01011168.1~~GHVL01011168.1.p2  ORF type:complete len:304 (-),score=65.40 GHVL01011168.1:2633-3544(-)
MKKQSDDQSSAKAEALQKSEQLLNTANAELATLRSAQTTLERSLKDEQYLRKKYFNEMEDMKGKIRVFCRVRPFAKYEIQKDCKGVVDIEDEFTTNVLTNRGRKTFTYDRCFPGNSTQEEVFEDTKRLIQSAVDGFNVCLFAYGQTGSGKTYTIQGGGAGLEGIAPRGINELFRILGELSETKWSVSCYMCELYNDVLVDLLQTNKKNPPSLEIKKEANGMVKISNVVIIEAHNPAELSALFVSGLESRHTSSTNMNDESSRSHLIFSVLVRVEDLKTQKTVAGKLSFIDLAGSERGMIYTCV